MTPEANAIIGLFFAMWSHEMLHKADERESRRYAFLTLVIALISAYWLLLALARSLGWLP